MKKKFRQTMTLVIDVWAEDEDEATELIADYYYDVPHEWYPDKIEIVEEEDDFFPTNEQE